MNKLEIELPIEDLDAVSSTETRGKLLKTMRQAFARLEPESLLQDCLKDVFRKGSHYRNIYVIGFGKASLKMYGGIREQVSGKAKYCGVIVPEGESEEGGFPELEILKGNHPIPSRATMDSSRRIIEPLSSLREEDLVLVLISGGGSALFEIPRKEYDIEDVGRTAKCLMGSGADIRELNAVRQAMSSVKGGKLAELLYPAEVHGFIISDVPGDNPSVIASGPLTRPAENSDFLERVLEKYSASCTRLKEIHLPGSGKSVEPKFFKHVTTKMVLKNMDFVNLITSLLEQAGETAIPLQEPVTGDVADVSKWFAEKMRRQFRISRKPVWIVGGGETTAKVHGNGQGGRNCELALRVALNMDDGEDFMFASLGTDGIDGASPAMGGISDRTLAERTSREEIEKYLSNSDSYTLLKKCDSAVVTGYTGTNVSDIFISYYAGRMEK